MRSISIVVTCDACGDEIEEEVEGASAIRFTVRGDEREMDLCDECLGGTFLQEARPVTNRKKREVRSSRTSVTSVTRRSARSAASPTT
jgi:ribosome-binding protein aMBF1 (putative translation factor)